jgi:hypothetical protein
VIGRDIAVTVVIGEDQEKIRRCRKRRLLEAECPYEDWEEQAQTSRSGKKTAESP